MMETQQISISRALVEIKTLNKRIEKLTKELSIFDISIGGKLKSNRSLEEFSQYAKSSMQQLEDLIQRYSKIKSQIVLSNSKTTVNVNGETFTVAEAIERKNSIKQLVNVVGKLKETFHSTVKIIDAANENSQTRLDKLLESTFSKDSSKVKPEEYEAVAKPFLERNEAKLVDPIDARKKIDMLEKYIEGFVSNIDIVLSESNAKTYITIWI